MGRPTPPATSAAWCARFPVAKRLCALTMQLPACLPACINCAYTVHCRLQADAQQLRLLVLT